MLENHVSKSLWHSGIRLRKNVRSLYGNPDFSIKKYKVVVFIDSCFWHLCPKHGTLPKSNINFWEKKLNRNMERDKEVTLYYQKQNWWILRVWEHEFKEDYDSAILKIADFIEFAKTQKK